MEPGFESSDIVTMFPTFVWRTQLKAEVYQSVNRQVLGSLEASRGGVVDIGPGESWQSEQNQHDLEPFRPLSTCILDAAKVVLKFLAVSYEALVITGCWINLNGKGTEHKTHSHPNNYLSGAYYVRVHEGADLVNFHDPRPQTGIIRPPVTALTSGNADQAVLKVKTGELLLFPSWLQHSVPANRSDRTRISTSFNLMFSPYTESMSKPLW